MSAGQLPALAEITGEAHARCLAIGGGAFETVEGLRAELEKNPEPGQIRIALVSPVRFADGGAGF
ncbi:hypothetical protein ACGF3G_12575 [Streptomyces sp. NPDC048179]|uniref:hypothetical protein n=1 Tax=Streptomyces sp. NPDC048179 TaxID=3365506 RepID=UPI00371D133E